MIKLDIGDVLTTITVETEDESVMIHDLLRFPDSKARLVGRKWHREMRSLLFQEWECGMVFKTLSGLCPWMIAAIQQRGFSVEIGSDESLVFRTREPFTPPDDYLKGIVLRDYQIDVVRKATFKPRGILALPTRSGKTAIAAAIMKKLDRPALFVVNSQFLLDQTVNSLRGFGLIDVGKLGDGIWDPGKYLVATVQSLDSRIGVDRNVANAVTDSQVVFFDEVHHLQANTWTMIGLFCQAPFRYGMSATPFYLSEKTLNIHDYSLVGLTGEVIATLSPQVLVNRGYISRPRIYFIPSGDKRVDIPKNLPDRMQWNYVYKHGVVDNEDRNNKFIRYAVELYNCGMKVLVLVTRKDHGETILYKLAHLVPEEDVIFSKGQRQVYEVRDGHARVNRWPFSMVRSFIESKDHVIVVGTTVYDEGVDLPSLDAVIILSAQGSFRLTVQRSGRPLTAQLGKEDSLIIDVDDRAHGWLINQSRKRRKVLEEMFGDSPILGEEDLRREINIRRPTNEKSVRV